MVSHGSVFTYAVLAILACFSILSLAIAFAKWSAFSAARGSDARFVRAFRKANSLETMGAAAENFRPTPWSRFSMPDTPKRPGSCMRIND